MTPSQLMYYIFDMNNKFRVNDNSSLVNDKSSNSLSSYIDRRLDKNDSHDRLNKWSENYFNKE